VIPLLLGRRGCEGLEGAAQRFIIELSGDPVLRTRTRTHIPAHAHAHTHAHAHWQLVKADIAFYVVVPADCVHDVMKCLEMRTIPDGSSRLLHMVVVEVAPAPQLAVHIRQPRRCLRGCRPRVTRTSTQSRPSDRPLQHQDTTSTPTRTYPSRVCLFSSDG